MAKVNYIAMLSEGKEPVDAKARIFAAALEEFAVNSLDAVRTRSIAKSAGVNHAAISYYFGGKSALYEEIARQITEFVEMNDAPKYERFCKIKESCSRSDAKELLKEFLASRMCCGDGARAVFRNLILIVMREEMYEGPVFEMIFKKVFEPFDNLLCELISIASGGKYVGERAKILSKMLIGQVHMFNSARAGMRLSLGWENFDLLAEEKVRVLNSELIDKILD